VQKRVQEPLNLLHCGDQDAALGAAEKPAAPTPPAAPDQQQGQENQARVLSPVLRSDSQSFGPEGLALARMRDLRLYQVDFDSFQAQMAEPPPCRYISTVWPGMGGG
jgi:hypothetical protein